MNSARSSAQVYLERIQRSTYEALGKKPDWMSAEHRSFVEDFAKRFYESQVRSTGKSFEEFMKLSASTFGLEADPTLSQFQDPAWHSLLRNLTGQLDEVLVQRNLKMNPHPIFGSLPTGRVNGMAIRVPRSDELIVLIEEGLFGFFNLAAKAVSRAFPFTGTVDGKLQFSSAQEDLDRELVSKPEISERYTELILAYVVGGHPHMAKPYLPEPNYDGISALLRESTELFVVGHEYGHFLSGHLSQDATQKAKLGEEATDEIMTNWNQEFEADVRGLELMLAAMGQKGYDLSLSFWGADFFFGCIDTIERAVSIIQTGVVSPQHSTTHPPTLMRRQLLHQVLQNSVPEEHRQGPIQLAGIVQSVLERMWSACEPILQRAHERGVELAPAWRH